MNSFLEQARQRLAKTSRQVPESPEPAIGHDCAPKSAAVLIPLLKADDGWHLLFIRRAQNGNDYHSGQVAFPGGCVEPGDADLEATALREAYEEIGLVPDAVNVLGRLDDCMSTTNYRIAPFVGVIPWPYRLRLAPAEVARAFSIPLGWLSDSTNRTTYEHPVASGNISVIRYRPYDGEVLWGATARITVSLMQTLGIGDTGIVRRRSGQCVL
jgi:8-oxo-dGTP pyrophosphatase MutT (NUDIX family)